MKLSMFSKSLLPGLVLLLATSAFAASKGSLVLDEAVTVSGHQLTPGEYQLRWDGAGPNVQLNILSKGKLVATVPAQVVERKHAGANDAYNTGKKSDGTLSLTQIKFGGKKYALALGDQAATTTPAPQKDSGSSTSNN